MLETVRNIISEIYYFCFSAYRNHSILEFSNFSLMSRVGPQQRDPFAGLLFCLAIQKLIRATRSAFTSGYMDNIALGGNIRDVARDVDHIRTEGEAIGLSLTIKNSRSFQDLTGHLKSYPNRHLLQIRHFETTG